MPAPNQQNLSSSTPAAPSGFQNVTWQRDGNVPRNDSANVPGTGGANVKTTSYQIVTADCGSLLVFNGSANGSFELPAAPPFARWCVFIENISSTSGSPPVTPVLTITPLSGSPPAGANLDGGSGSISLSPGQGVYIATDGTNYYSVRGASSTSVPAAVSETPAGTLNGSNKAFTLTYTPNPAPSLTLYLNGVEQVLTTDYAISGGSITFTVAPKSTDLMKAQYTH